MNWRLMIGPLQVILILGAMIMQLEINRRQMAINSARQVQLARDAGMIDSQQALLTKVARRELGNARTIVCT